jgi:hypothetical protein
MFISSENQSDSKQLYQTVNRTQNKENERNFIKNINSLKISVMKLI